MNYKLVTKKNKKNTVLLVVALILSLVLVGGAVAGIGYAFDWWNFGKEEAKELPTSTYNLNVGSVDEIVGIEITAEDFVYLFDQDDQYAKQLENWEQNSSTMEKPEKPDYFMAYGNVLLNVDYYGQEFKVPENGLYNVTFKVNGEEYSVEKVAFELNADDAPFMMFTVDFKTGKLIDGQVGEGDFNGITVALSDNVLLGGENGLSGDAHAILIQYYDADEAFETFELVKFEKVAELPEAESGEDVEA